VMIDRGKTKKNKKTTIKQIKKKKQKKNTIAIIVANNTIASYNYKLDRLTVGLLIGPSAIQSSICHFN